MNIRPIISPDIVGQYVLRGNTIVDTWTNKILYNGNDALKTYQQVRKAGRLNFAIVESNARTNSNKPLLYVMA